MKVFTFRQETCLHHLPSQTLQRQHLFSRCHSEPESTNQVVRSDFQTAACVLFWSGTSS